MFYLYKKLIVISFVFISLILFKSYSTIKHKKIKAMSLSQLEYIKEFQQQNVQQQNVAINDFGLDITSWNKSESNIKNNLKNSQDKISVVPDDVQKYYKKKSKVNKTSELEEIMKFNQLAISSKVVKNKFENSDFEGQKYFKSTFQSPNQSKIQDQFSYFKDFSLQQTPQPNQNFFQTKNLLNQNKFSLKKVNKNQIFIYSTCIILFVFETQYSFLSLSCQLFILAMNTFCFFLNEIFVPNEQRDEQSNNIQIRHKNVICFQKRIFFYKLFKYSLIFVYAVSVFKMIQILIQKAQFFNLRLILLILIGASTFYLVLQINKILFLEKEIYNHQKNFDEKNPSANQIQDSFDFS